MEANHIRVLFVEDDQQFAEMVGEMLRRHKAGVYQIKLVVTLGDALRMLDQDDFDVALVDLYLPDSEGLDTVRRLRKRSATLPIVILTGRKEAELARNALRFGAQDSLEKTELLPSLLVRVISYAIQRRQAELRLAESERRYRQLVEQMKDVIYRLDESAHIIYISPSVEELLGLKREDLLGQEVTALTRPDHRQQMRTELEQHLQEQSPAIHILAPGPKDKEDGGTTWLEHHLYPLRSEGHLLGLQGIARDVTELKRARDELEASQRELEERVRRRTRQLEAAKQEWERTFDAVPDLIAIIDPDYRLVRINRAFARRLGKEPQELIGRYCYEVIHGSDSPREECPLTSTLEDHREHARMLYEDRLNAYMLVTTSPLFDNQGRLQGVVHVARDISALKEAEKTLSEQFILMRQLMDAIPNPVFIKDLNGNYIDCNRAFLEFSGVEKKDIIGKSTVNLVGKELAEAHFQMDARLLAEGKAVEYESKVLHADGSLRDVIINKAVYTDAQGKPAGIVGVIQDISQRKQAEQALRESEWRYRLFLDRLPDPTVVYDLKGRVITSNRAFKETFGWSAKEIEEQKVQFVPPEALEETREKIRHMRKGLPVARFETVRLTKDGRRLNVELNTSPLYDDEGNHIGNIVVMRDVTAVKEAEAARRQTEERFRNLVETMNEGLTILNPDGTVQYCNAKFCEMLGYQCEEVTGQPFTKFLDRKNREHFERCWAEGRRKGEGSFELVFQKKEGGRVFALVSPRVDVDEQGRLVNAFMVVTDITRSKDLESQLVQAQKLEAIGQLAAGIAHEINTPAQYVTSNTRFLSDAFQDLIEYLSLCRRLQDQLKQAGQAPEQVSALERQAEEMDLDFVLEEIPKALEANLEGLERIAKIVRSLKEFAHPGGEDKQPTDLNRAIETTVTVARNEWKYVADVKLDLDPELPPVPCVVSDFNQALLNLIVNAAQAIGEVVTEGVDEKGLITISTRRVGDEVEIRVTDNGPGIPEAIQDKIFDPFFTTKEPGKGTGQGLAIAYRAIVERHGGSLTCISQEGKGTTFLIKLPL
jgi:PAS domain S-box-containing protein